MQEMKTKLHYQFLETKIPQQDINNTLNFILNLVPGMVAKWWI
jgi:hypothetical protein